MKNIIIAFLFCLPLFSEAQIFQDTGYKSKALWATSLMKPPTDTLTHKQGIALKNGILYYGNGINWIAASAGAGGAYLLLSDTASMLTNYAKKAIADSSFFKSLYGKRTQSGRFVFNKTALAWDSLQSFKITDSTRSASNKLYGHETKFIKGFEEAAYDSLYISRIKVNAATGVELSFSDQNNSDTNNIVKVDANGFTINIPSKGAGKVLQSDVNGNATWVVPAGGGGAATDTTNKFINSIAVKNDSVITYNRGGNFTDIAVKGATDRLTNSLVNYVDKTTAQTIGGSKTFTDNLLIGTVPAFGFYPSLKNIRYSGSPAYSWGAHSMTMDGGGCSIMFGNSNDLWMTSNAFFTGSTWTRKATGAAGNIGIVNGSVMLRTVPSGTGDFSFQNTMMVENDNVIIDPTTVSYFRVGGNNKLVLNLTNATFSLPVVINAGNNLTVASLATGLTPPTTTGTTRMLITDANGLFSFSATPDSSKWSLTGSNISNKNSGNVGIGIAVPTSKLHVGGTVKATGSITSNDVGYFDQGLSSLGGSLSGFASLASGTGSNASNSDAIALGQNANASGEFAIAGSQSTASGRYSTALSNGTAKALGGFATGQNNTGDAPDPLVAATTDRIFQVGTGGSNIVTTLRNGNTGFGLLVPTSTVSVGGSLSTSLVSKSANYTATAADNTINVTAAAVTITLPTAVGIQGREYTIINSTSGNITITTTASQTIGNFVTTTSFTLATDKALKVQSDNTNYKIKGQY